MTVVIIGGGASGMIAALTAAQNGHHVQILERQARVGRKLLSTGNGRCNLTNLNMGETHYHGQSPAFIRPAMSLFGTQQTLDFFHGLGLLTVAEESGRVYPLSDQAGSVVDVLRFALEEAGVEVRTGFEVSALKKKGDVFRITSAEGEMLTCDRVLICCGGMAGGKLGGTQSGYELLKAQGHSATKLFPALVQIKTDNTYVRSLKGVRADAAVELRQGETVLDASQGEVQFTEFGISGPVGFELSRTAATAKGKLTAHIDLLRQVSMPQLQQALEDRVRTMPHLTMENLLVGLLHNRLGRTVLRYAGYGLADPVRSLRPADLKRIAAAMKDFALPVLGVHGFDGAQVTAGGIHTDEFDPQTLQSRLVSGLYAAGEVLDIDGDCGGYNLQWAWASGYLAGLLK
ncbi:MAG: NAD(P)/FAD-dependent oxidoreductase [Oscillibacter sp.]|nr:NAD(P)/FAD-dependent oxidoreductase [Oscillibacter sp.]